jgi:uncharacterized protein (DUF924 family)
MASIDDILDFWFGAPARTPDELMAKARRWFSSGAALDPVIRERFGADVERAVRGELEPWTESGRGSLAVVLLLDQMTRHVYRDDRRMYDGDARAQEIAARAWELGLDGELDWEQKPFLVMPFAHAEELGLQERGAAIIARLAAEAPPLYRVTYDMGLEQTAKYQGVIRRFGRFPHRNGILGRASTSEEMAFLLTFAQAQPPAAMRAAG